MCWQRSSSNRLPLEVDTLKSRCLSFSATLILGACLAGTALADPFPTGYVRGDVFVSVGDGSVKVFTPTGTLVATLNDTTGATFTTGSAFDSAGNFYVTNFNSTISKFSNTGALVAATWATGNNNNESIVPVSTGTYAGDFFSGGPTAATIDEFNSAGTLIHTFSVPGGNGTGGTDWLDFQNTDTVLYDGEGSEILSYNITTNTANGVFASGIASNYALRVIPAGATDAGDVLIADSSRVELFSSTGTLIKTYTLPGDDGGDFALNLDPNGTDFWTADPSGTVWEVNIATGAIDEQWSSGSPGTTFGLAVFGEITTSGPPPPGVPEPSSMLLLGTIGALVAFTVRKRFASR
jgi:PEP-CTERM motif